MSVASSKLCVKRPSALFPSCRISREPQLYQPALRVDPGLGISQKAAEVANKPENSHRIHDPIRRDTFVSL
jgi:hypothetical protein